MTTPLRVQPLEYSPPPAGRPGLVTAIGVLSIVIGGLSILSNLTGVIQGFGMMTSSNWMSAMTTTPATTAPAAVTTPTTGPPVIPRIPAVMTFVAAVVGFALAIYLLVIGILVFRGSPNGARQHGIYAWIKIAQCLLGGAAALWLWAGFMGSAGGGAGALSAVLGIFVVLPVLIGLAYPIGLLIALRSASVRAYYQGGRDRA